MKFFKKLAVMVPGFSVVLFKFYMMTKMDQVDLEILSKSTPNDL